MSQDLRPEDFPPGAIITASGYMQRYRAFDVCLASVMKPPGTVCGWREGVNFEFNWNEMIRTIPSCCEWVWILGDDHVFAPDLLLRLLKRDVDVVVPLCMSRGYPFTPVVREMNEKTADLSIGKVASDELIFNNAAYDPIDGQSGLLELKDYATGNAGMLIRKSALEKIGSPWFEVGKIHCELHSSDLHFCLKLKRVGIPLFLDTENTLGHIGDVAVWPRRMEDGTWTAELRPLEDVGTSQRAIPVPRSRNLSGRRKALWTGAFNGYQKFKDKLNPDQDAQFLAEAAQQFPEIEAEGMEAVMARYGLEASREG